MVSWLGVTHLLVPVWNLFFILKPEVLLVLLSEGAWESSGWRNLVSLCRRRAQVAREAAWLGAELGSCPVFWKWPTFFGDKSIRIKWGISVAFIRNITMIMIQFCVQNDSRLGFGHSLAVRPPAGACPSTNPWAPASLPETLDSDWLSASPPLPLWPISFEQPCALRPGVRGNLVTYLSFLPIFSYR